MVSWPVTLHIYGNPSQQKVLHSEIRTGNFQVVLTTYEYIIKDRIHLSRMKWIYMIIGTCSLCSAKYMSACLCLVCR